MHENCAKSAPEIQEICSKSAEEMQEFRRKPLGYFAKNRLEEARDELCWIQKEVRMLNKTNIDAGGRQALFEILDRSYLVLAALDDVLRLQDEKEHE